MLGGEAHGLQGGAGLAVARARRNSRVQQHRPIVVTLEGGQQIVCRVAEELRGLGSHEHSGTRWLVTSPLWVQAGVALCSCFQQVVDGHGPALDLDRRAIANMPDFTSVDVCVVGRHKGAIDAGEGVWLGRV